MPRLREDYVFPNSQAHEKYDYETLLDGQTWQCFQGSDFTTEPNSFAQSLYSAARRRMKRAQCKIQADGSVIVKARAMTESELAHEQRRQALKAEGNSHSTAQ